MLWTWISQRVCTEHCNELWTDVVQLTVFLAIVNGLNAVFDMMWIIIHEVCWHKLSCGKVFFTTLKREIIVIVFNPLIISAAVCAITWSGESLGWVILTFVVLLIIV